MSVVQSLSIGYDYDAPLRWEHVDGRSGHTVHDIPKFGRVFFFDQRGPVLRLDHVTEARWLVRKILLMSLGREITVRITRITALDSEYPEDGYFWIIPNPTQPLVIHCTHEGAHKECGGDCRLLDEFVGRYITTPLLSGGAG